MLNINMSIPSSVDGFSIVYHRFIDSMFENKWWEKEEKHHLA